MILCFRLASDLEDQSKDLREKGAERVLSNPVNSYTVIKRMAELIDSVTQLVEEQSDTAVKGTILSSHHSTIQLVSKCELMFFVSRIQRLDCRHTHTAAE